MNMYLTDSGVPELGNLTAAQRRVVRRGAFALLCQEHPSTRWLVGLPTGIGGGLSCGLAIGLSHSVTVVYRLVFAVLVGAIGVGVGVSIGAYRLTKQLPPYFTRFIQEHGDEIAGVA